MVWSENQSFGGVNPTQIRSIYMDNYYYCSVRLFYELLALINVLACGTVRTNRKGWPK